MAVGQGDVLDAVDATASNDENIFPTVDTNAFYNEGYQQGLKDGYDKGYNEGFAAGKDAGSKEGYDIGYGIGYDQGYQEGAAALKPVSMPASGTIFSGSEGYDSEITVIADTASSYVISLKYLDGTECVTFFVRANETATIGVPGEYLLVYFASGGTWYGYGEGLMFGDETVYSKDEEALDFENYTWEYTLYPVTDGNFEEAPSDEGDFFG